MTIRITLAALSVSGDALPTEFRLFRKGLNKTAKGVFLFDDAAAASVMAAYHAEDNVCVVDLEHLSLDSSHPHYDPDARAHFQLAVRDGELWATNVTWTPDGARRLREKTQRYPSPAFLADEKGRISAIVNVGLVAQPATYGAAALVAANKRGLAPPTGLGKTSGARSPQGHRLSKTMTPEQVKKIMAALEANDAEALASICKELLAAAAGGGDAPAADVAASDALSDTAADEPKPEEMLGLLTARLTKLEADKTASVKTLTARIAELEADKSAEEQAERVKLCGELVKLGAETPATAWAERAKETDPLKPSKRLQGIAIGDLREHVTALSTRGPIINAEPAASGPKTVKLSKDEQAYCTKHGLTPEQFQAKKAGAVRSAK